MIFLNLREVYLLFISYSLVIGCQISIYFFYQYHKRRKNNLNYDKILLSYGLMAILFVVGYWIQLINQFYISNNFLNNHSFKITGLFFLLAVILFLIYATRAFPQIFNTQSNKGMVLISFSAIAALFLNEINYVFFIYMSIVGIICCFWVLICQIRIMKLTTGAVRTTLIKYTIGLSLSFSGAIITTLLFVNQLESTIYLTATIMIFIGFTISLMVIYNFPAFLEFQWQENLRGLYIFNKDSYNLLYSFNFDNYLNKETELNEAPLKDIFSRGLTGIQNLLDELTVSKGTMIDKIKQGDYFVFLDKGDRQISHILFALIVKRDMNSYKYFLKEIKKSFQDSYKNLIKNLELFKENQEQLFINFNEDIINLLK